MSDPKPAKRRKPRGPSLAERVNRALARVAEQPESTHEAKRGTLETHSRRNFLLFGAGALATATTGWWVLPDRTKRTWLPAAHNQLDTLTARIGLTRQQREKTLNRVLTFDDDVAEALASGNRTVRTYDQPDPRPLRILVIRYRFIGDKHLFFWLLSNRMAPAAVFALPFFQLYSAVGLFDTPWAVALAHTLFNVPLAVWILEGFMSGVPKELDETAYVDGYSFPGFFFKIFVPTIAAGIGVACFFCFMFSWVELLLAKTLTSVAAKPIAATMTKTASSSGYELGLLAAAGTLTIIPGAFVIYFVRNYIAKGFALGRV